MSENIHFDIKMEIDNLREAIRAREVLDKNAAATIQEKADAEVAVCIKSRALFSKYVDTGLWRDIGKIDTENVRSALAAARACISTDPFCEESVERRLKDFDKFSATGQVAPREEAA